MKPADNFCVKTLLTLQAALPANHSNNTGTTQHMARWVKVRFVL